MKSLLVLSCSPRPGGNSDLLAERCVAASSLPCSYAALREYEIIPCTGCGACQSSGRCMYARRDQAEELFAMLDAASHLILTAPVYFYHFPAHAKAWIDRAQSRYGRNLHLSVAKPAYAVFVAGRPQGNKLFDGMTLTLKYFLKCFGFRLTDTLCFRGFDAAGAVVENPDVLHQMDVLGKRCT